MGKIKKKNSSNIIPAFALGIGGLVVLTALFFIFNPGPKSENTPVSSAGDANGDITIIKSEVTATAQFIPYDADGTKMEIIAVKAPDGTVRTAFNTCQVCFDSGRGYYQQKGDELICQNCGNRFTISQIEKIKGGCNPVPILPENKTDDGSKIVIAKNFLLENQGLFAKWKKG